MNCSKNAGIILKKIMMARNTTREMLADYTGVSTATIDNYISGKSEMKLQFILNVLDYYRITFEDFMYGNSDGIDVEDTYISSTFSLNLRYLCFKYQIDPNGLAENCDITIRTANNYLNGVSEPNVLDLAVLSTYFCVPMDKLYRERIRKGKIHKYVYSLWYEKDENGANEWRSVLDE